MIAEFAFLLSLLLIVYLSITSWPVARRRRRYRSLARAEAARSYWGEAREELFNLVRDGKLDIRSETFRSFNAVQTFMLRRPDAYGDIAQQLLDMITVKPSGGQPKWAGEIHDWPDEMTQILEKMGKGIGVILFGFAKRARLAALAVQVTGWMATRASSHVYGRAISLVRRIPVVKDKTDLLIAMNRLGELQAAA